MRTYERGYSAINKQNRTDLHIQFYAWFFDGSVETVTVELSHACTLDQVLY